LSGAAPLVHELAPTPDPLETCARFQDLPFLLFLDSATDPEHLGRYSFLAADPVTAVRSKGLLTQQLVEGKWIRVAGDPLAHVGTLVSSHAAAPLAELPPFQGGAAGYVGYDWGMMLERVPRPRYDDLAVPDLLLGLYDWVIAWDHPAGRAWAISTGMPERGAARERRAAQRLAFVKDRLARPGAGGLPARQKDAGRSAAPSYPVPGVPGVRSNFTRQGYLDAVGRVIEYVFAGDIFQMEDQRNWTDATFKTFCTPLDLPCPIEIRQGARVSQRIILSVQEHQPAVTVPFSEEPVSITVGTGAPLPMPAFGLGVASHPEPLAPKEVEWLRVLQPSHLRVDLRLWEPDWKGALQRAIVQTRQLGCELEAAVFVSNFAREELEELGETVAQEGPAISRSLIFHQSENATSERWILLARKFLQSPIGSGTNANFNELGAFQPHVDGLDFISFSIHPQEHTFDHASVMETLPIQEQVVQNARRIHGGLPVIVSPVTLKPRFNPNATGPQTTAGPDELPTQVDTRQMSLFGAVWTLGSLKYLCESGVDSVTYYENTGWRGVKEREAGSPLREKFPSVPGATFPL